MVDVWLAGGLQLANRWPWANLGKMIMFTQQIYKYLCKLYHFTNQLPKIQTHFPCVSFPLRKTKIQPTRGGWPVGPAVNKVSNFSNKCRCPPCSSWSFFGNDLKFTPLQCHPLFCEKTKEIKQKEKTSFPTTKVKCKHKP